MRILATLAVWMLILGGIQSYLSSRSVVTSVEALRIEATTEQYELKFTTSFDLEPDPFALTSEAGDTTPAMLLKLNGHTLLAVRDRVEAGQALSCESVQGLIQGRNEFYLEASPPLERSHLSHAIRIQIFRHGEMVAERTFWSVPGVKLQETFVLEIHKTANGNSETLLGAGKH